LILIGGALVAYRSGHGFAVGWFLGIGLALLVARLLLTGEPLSNTLWFVVTSYPLLFMGLFMVSEPLTMATRRSDQFLTATAMAVPTALPFTVPLGFTTLSSSPELALLLGNLVAWATTALRAVNRASSVTLHSKRPLTDHVTEYRFVASRPLRIEPGQWVELQLPHRGADSRGSRRVMSVSRLAPPAEQDEWSFAVTTRHANPGSSWKAALASLQPGARLRVSSVGGDFVPPHALVGQMVMVAGGVGITPFAAQLFNAADRELGIEATLIVVPSHSGDEIYPELSHVRGVRRVVTNSLDNIDTLLPSQDAISWAGVSGSPTFVKSARDALEKAGVRQVHTDRFIGY
jgi:ferredoxin-NADP reductase